MDYRRRFETVASTEICTLTTISHMNYHNFSGFKLWKVKTKINSNLDLTCVKNFRQGTGLKSGWGFYTQAARASAVGVTSGTCAKFEPIKLRLSNVGVGTWSSASRGSSGFHRSLTPCGGSWGPQGPSLSTDSSAPSPHGWGFTAKGHRRESLRPRLVHGCTEAPRRD